MQFVRAPDENVFIAPFNLIEIFCLILPFEWWMSKKHYERLNDYVMGLVYAPLLLVTAFIETKEARHVRYNRSRGEPDDDQMHEWEVMAADHDPELEAWKEKAREVAPDMTATAVSEVKKLRKEIDELKELVLSLKKDDNKEEKKQVNGETNGSG
jgi:hypothetical protein